MPPRVTARRRLLADVLTEPYVCSTCRQHAAARAGLATGPQTHYVPERKPTTRFIPASSVLHTGLPGPRLVTKTVWRHVAKRYASNGSLASATAINAPSTVPPPYRELHQRLLVLQDQASTYVNLSRLQLAGRSLEGEHPVIRVALLGFGGNGAQAARKLARVLLSDALSDEGAWEQELLESAGDGRSLLIRYGDSEDVVQQSPLVQTLHIPSPFLRRNNVEILVTTLNTNGSSNSVPESELEEAILVPPLTTPTSASGRVGFVRYPVHKAVVIAEGITGAVEYGRLPRFIDKAELINAALNLPLRSSTGEKTAEQTATDNVVDIDLATHALGLFRTNKANGAQFSEEWQTSRLPVLTQWVAGPKEAETDGMRHAVRSLLNSVMLNTSAAVENFENVQNTTATSSTIPESKREKLNNLITDFSADWHRDLQTNLSAALQSKSWRRTAWWRLLWRIDDVSVSASDVLRLAWLTEAEQSIAFISGRIEEAGLATADELREAAGSDVHHIVEGAEDVSYQMSRWEPKKAQIISAPPKAMQTAELFQVPTLLSRVKEESGVNTNFDPPWPRTIHLARQQMLHTLVPEMHRKAQALLLQTLSTAGGASALGVWIYIATAGGAVQGAGAIAALGIVWSLRRLQRLWGKERDGFTVTVQENGRRVLAEVETHLRRLVKDGGRATVRSEDAESWRQARAAIQQCRETLERVK